jgi:hypothetical protein
LHVVFFQILVALPIAVHTFTRVFDTKPSPVVRLEESTAGLKTTLNPLIV